MDDGWIRRRRRRRRSLARARPPRARRGLARTLMMMNGRPNSSNARLIARDRSSRTRDVAHPSRAPVDVGVEDHPRSSVCVFHRRWTDDCTERRVVHDRETKERRRGVPSPPYCNTVKRRVRRAKSDDRLASTTGVSGRGVCAGAGGWMRSRDPRIDTRVDRTLGGGWMWSRDPRTDTRVDRTRETEKHWKRTREGSAGVAGVVGGRGGSRPVV